MEQKVILIIIGMSVVTYLPRILPMVLLSKVNLPPLFLKWLQFIPVAVLSALLAPAILAPQGELSIGLDNNAFIASIPCFFVAIKTKNLFLTVMVGILAMFLLQNL
ncbi:MAG: AzlD domain-containing protein [Caldicoprobacter sp.]|uniref:AzlD domain-containing protein n=1 Tax=Caldicoprobacter sp. TaxID=2004500 RepID=UPI001DAAF267|nr:branched chain amino acid ABC transporter [Clostridia bacterium]